MKLAELLGYAADVAPMSVPSVLALHLAVTCALVGLIWFVQLVHYPLFAAVGEAGYPDYQRRHVRWTTVVVAPLMLVEAATAAWLAAAPPADHLAGPLRLGFVLLLGVWLSTAFLQVPQHRRLAAGFDAAAHRRLVRSNWLRTALWTARAALLLAAGAGAA